MTAEKGKISLEGRQMVAMIIIGAMVLVMMVGLVRLQVVEHAEMAEQSEFNRIRVLPTVPRRGVVYDRFGEVIIDNRPSYTLSVVPAEEERDSTLANLASLIELDSTQIRKRIQKNMVSRNQPAPVKRDIPFEAVAVLEEQARRFPGVVYQMERVRKYEDSLGAEAFTGFVGEVSEDERQRLGQKEYRLGSMIGKKGLEKHYDSRLRGQEGTAYIEVSASGQILGPYTEKDPIPAVPGQDLYLSIDYDLQRAAVAALDTFCCGAVVAIDPRNGELLAMTSYPGFDANIFSGVIPESLWLAITNDSTHPLLNRPLNGLYPPGSTAKFVAVGAALEEGLVNENTTMKPCVGGYQFGNRFFGCWLPQGHGQLTAVHSLEQSCDTYLYQVGLKLGIDRLADYYAACGFGKPTGIDLPNEAAGLNPTTKYYDQRYGKNGWTRGLVLNNSIGQGELLTTPLQVAQLFCGLANDGVVYKPHILKRIVHADGREETVEPTVSFRLSFSSSTMRLLQEGLRLVVEGEHGTARRLKNKYYSIGGKTGTAENPHGENHSWFVGVAPLEQPEIVVCAIVENAGHGSDVAAPLVGSIIRSYMEKRLEIPPPKLERSTATTAPPATPARSDSTRDTTLVRASEEGAVY